MFLIYLFTYVMDYLPLILFKGWYILTFSKYLLNKI
jgi:hypothetical protein